MLWSVPMSQSMLPFILFALVASLSPGPTNLLILAHGARLAYGPACADPGGLLHGSDDCAAGGPGAGQSCCAPTGSN